MVKPLFDSDDLGLVVFSPDAVRSQLIGSLEREIASLTGCVPVFRRWFCHTPASIEAFYKASIPNNTPHWHLVSALFNSGPSLAVIWRGEDAIAKLDAVKGSSHPAEATLPSIRSRYWCDNPVMNLIHVSDDRETAINEIEIIQTCAGELNLNNQVLECLPDDNTTTMPHIEHSGVLVFLRVVRSLVESYTNIRLGTIELPKDGSAKLSQSIARTKLEKYADVYPAISKCIQLFLEGSSDTIHHLEFLVPLTPWDKLAISCGVVARKRWNRSPLWETIESIRSILPADLQWIFSGSAALAMHGFKCKPNDIDIWCSKDAFQAIGNVLGIEKTPYSVANLQGEVIKWWHCGWEVEIVSPLINAEGTVIGVDAQMLAQTNPNRQTESIEDLVAELLLLRRPEPKTDLKRALSILTTFWEKIDHDYLSWRLSEWNVPESLIKLTDSR